MLAGRHCTRGYRRVDSSDTAALGAAAPDDRLHLQQALGDGYGLEAEIGRGGMARVYRAHDRKHDRRVALKVLHREVAQTLGAERFRREIRLVAGLQHPHIVPVFDSGEAAGLLWFTMPLVAGESLRDRLVRERQLPVADAVGIARALALALDYAHGRGVVHRDVKPENVLLTEDGQTLLADFGVARLVLAPGAGTAPTDTAPTDTALTGTGWSVGTPAYMSPEQGAGEREVDGRSDQYALACVLYECLAGEPPFTGPTAQAVLAKRFAGPAPDVGVLRDGVPPAVRAAL
ncbi:MAG: Serine/threonine protein kinase, partial [uncultured Gemmatimonadaceae bacterium]